MGQITIDQSHQIMATLATNTDWAGIDFKDAGLQDRIIANPKEAGRQFGIFLRNGGRVIVNIWAFQVWKTIKLGTHKTAETLKAAIKQKGIEVSDWSADIMGKPAFTLASQETTVDLVNVSVADLGFTKATALKDIYARALELGLSLCPVEVGPQLRRQYTDQPKGEYLRVAMDAIADSDGSPNIFSVVHDDDDRWLNAHWGSPGILWSPATRFVFRK